MGVRLSGAQILTGAGLFAALVSQPAADSSAPKGLSPPEYNVFAASAGQSQIALIDPDLLVVVGFIDLAFEAKQISVSARLKAIAAIDGRLPELRVYDLTTNRRRSISLPFVPTLLVRSPDDTRLAVMDNLHGRFAVIDLERRAVIVTSSVGGAVEDALFSTDGGALYLAGPDLLGVTVIDIDGGSTREVEGTNAVRFAGLSRSPNGRDGFGKPQGSNVIQEFDLRRRTIVGSLDVTPDTSFAFVTGTGRFILLPDSHRRELRVATTDPLKVVATLRGSSTMDAAYSAWFDSLAYVTSPLEHRILAYDLDHFAPLGEIPVGGTPGPAVVGPGGDKLFIPLIDAKAVEVVDAVSQHVTAHIPLDANPTALALAGGYGICH